MPAPLLTIFVSLTWGLALLFGLVLLGILAGNNTTKRKFLNLKLEAESLDLFVKKSLLAKMAMRGGSPLTAPSPVTMSGISDKLKELMKMSPDHPEVKEIEEDDEVVGVLFKSDSYPPDMEENTTDDNDNNE